MKCVQGRRQCKRLVMTAWSTARPEFGVEQGRRTPRGQVA